MQRLHVKVVESTNAKYCELGIPIVVEILVGLTDFHEKRCNAPLFVFDF